MYTGKYPRWFIDNALGLRPRALSETTSRIFPVYTGYLEYNLYMYMYVKYVYSIMFTVYRLPLSLLRKHKWNYNFSMISTGMGVYKCNLSCG